MLDTLTVLESLECDILMYAIRLLRGLLNCHKSLKLRSIMERCVLSLSRKEWCITELEVWPGSFIFTGKRKECIYQHMKQLGCLISVLS
jgi:hypothetical protein